MKRSIISIVIIGITTVLNATHPPVPSKVPEKYDKLILFIDYLDEVITPEKGSGFTTDAFIRALANPEAIILSTTSVFKNILFQQEVIHDLATLDLEALKTKYPAYYKKTGEKNLQEYIKLSKALVAQDFEQSKTIDDELHSNSSANTINSFDSYIACHAIKLDQWSVLQLDADNYFCLLVPKAMVGDAKLEMAAGAGVTDLEFNLGVKVNHFKPLDFSTVKKFDRPAKKNVLFEAFKTIFVTPSEYHQAKKESREAAWIFVFWGHGSTFEASGEFDIACIESLELANMLSLIEFLRTAFASISSCFSAGLNLEFLMKTVKDQLLEKEKKEVSYVITSNAANDNVTISNPVRVDFTKTGITLKGGPDFATYFKAAARPSPNYLEALNALVPFVMIDPVTKQPTSTANPYNIAVIVEGGKIIGPISVPGTFAQFDEGFVKSQTGEQHINLAQQFGKENRKPDTALLMVPEIKSPLDIDYKLTTTGQPLAPYFISFISGPAIHDIKEINDPNVTTDEFLEVFAHYPLQRAKKIIWIEKLATKSGTLEDVIFVNKPLEEGVEQIIYYTKDGEYYQLNKTVKDETAEQTGIKGFAKEKLKESYVPAMKKEWKEIEDEKYGEQGE